MKKLTIIAISGLLFAAGSVHATRVLEILERSYELKLSDTTLPQSTQGRVGFKPCDTCAYDYMPVGPSTVYLIGRRAATLAEFAEEATRIRRLQGAAASTLVMLHYDPDTVVATRLRISSQ